MFYGVLIMANKLPETPKEVVADTLIKLFKTAADCKTFGFASNVIEFLVRTPLEKKTQKWNEAIRDNLQYLLERDEKLIENLATDSAFQDVLFSATLEAYKTSEERKLDALQFAVLNSALDKDPIAARRKIFMRMLADFSELHLRMLILLDSPVKEFDRKQIKYESIPMQNFAVMIRQVEPDFEANKAFYSRIVKELQDQDLVTVTDLTLGPRGAPTRIKPQQYTASADGIGQPFYPDTIDLVKGSHTSEFGREFIKFISDPRDQK